MREGSTPVDRLVLCTGNVGKQAEMTALLPPGLQLLSLADVGLPADLPETGATLEANALQKARSVFEHCGLPCIADDSGLEVRALNGAPGVLSARFAGPTKDTHENMRKLLREMEGITDRSARFRTVIAYVCAEGDRLFEGEVCGTITVVRRGTNGFGYDPIFEPSGSSRTFGEMSGAEKNSMSHRARAIAALLSVLR